MNYKISLYITFLLSIFHTNSHAQNLAYFEAVEITGTFAELNINEGNVNSIEVKHQLPNESDAAYSTSTSDLQTTITLLQKGVYNISVPKGVKIICTPTEVAGESDWYSEQKNYKVALRNLTGEVIVNADGYDVQLQDVGGPTSVVTYGNIKATYSQVPTADFISLDTYQGNITIQIPDESNANIKATAKNGTVVFADVIAYDKINDIIKLQGNVDVKVTAKNGAEIFADAMSYNDNNQLKTIGNVDIKVDNRSSIKLHTEDGAYIRFNTNQDPTHPELRDKLIKLYIRDQGKMPLGAAKREELSKMGFKDFLDSQPEIRPFTGSTLAEELSALIDQYGFPTPEMVGDDYAMSGVQMVLFNSSSKYMDRYKEEYKKYWPKMLEIYYMRGNGK